MKYVVILLITILSFNCNAVAKNRYSSFLKGFRRGYNPKQYRLDQEEEYQRKQLKYQRRQTEYQRRQAQAMEERNNYLRYGY